MRSACDSEYIRSRSEQRAEGKQQKFNVLDRGKTDLVNSVENESFNKIAINGKLESNGKNSLLRRAFCLLPSERSDIISAILAH